MGMPTFRSQLWSNALSANFTPSAGFGTVTNQAIYTRRVGDTLYVRGQFRLGTAAGSVASILLPAGYVIDTAKISNSSVGSAVGHVRRLASGVNFENGGQRSADAIMIFDGTNTDRVFLSYGGDSGPIYQKGNVNDSGGFGNNDYCAFEFSIPIVGW